MESPPAPPVLTSRKAWYSAHEQFETLWMSRQTQGVLPLAEALAAQAPVLFGERHPACVRGIQDLALAYQLLERSDESTREQQRAADFWETLRERARIAPESHEAALFYKEEAARRADLEGRSDETDALFDRAETLIRRLYGEGSVEAAEVAAERGEALFVAGDHESAVAHYARARDLFDQCPGADSPWPARVLRGLAQTLHELGRGPEALAHFERALALAEQDPPRREALYALLISYAETLEAHQQTDQADALRRRAQALLPKTDPSVFQFRV